jgi:hypothetical protein
MKNIDRIIYLLSKEGLQDNKTHPAESLIKELDIEKLYFGYFSSKVICEIIILFSRCNNLSIEKKRLILRRCLVGDCDLIKQSILKVFDFWEDKDLLLIIDKHIKKNNSF